ncbi:hypothetical protein QBC36DRAFT_305366, partial [Triangularia setosa]
MASGYNQAPRLTKMMTPLARSESIGPQLIGPLTTIYTPSHNCRFGFVESGNSDASTATLETISYAYSSSCLNVRPCLPSLPTAVRRDYYSPGLYCPMEWEIATKLTHGMTDSVRAINILQALSIDETAAFCCPSGFTFSYTGWSSTDALPYCASTMIEGTFTYWTCNPRGYSLDQTLRVGETITITIPIATSEHLRIRATDTLVPLPDVYARQYAVGTSKFSTQAPILVVSSAITRAPAIQLVWRSADLSIPVNNETTVDSTPVNTTGVIVGVTVGAVVVVCLIALGMWVWVQKRRQKTEAVSQLQSTEPIENTRENEKVQSELATEISAAKLSTAAASPELPASPVTSSNTGGSNTLFSTVVGVRTTEVVSGPPVAYELDTGLLGGEASMFSRFKNYPHESTSSIELITCLLGPSS